MDIQLQELLTKIKEDGIEKVTKESNELRSAAKKEAEEIVQRARKQAQSLQQKAEETIRRREESSKQSLRNAARDMLLSFEQNLKGIIERIIAAKVKNALTGEALQKLIITALEQYVQSGKALSLILPEDTKSSFIDAVTQELQKTLKIDVHAVSDKNLPAGFQLKYSTDDVLIDYSYDHIKTEFLSLISPYLQSIVKEL